MHARAVRTLTHLLRRGHERAQALLQLFALGVQGAEGLLLLRDPVCPDAVRVSSEQRDQRVWAHYDGAYASEVVLGSVLQARARARGRQLRDAHRHRRVGELCGPAPTRPPCELLLDAGRAWALPHRAGGAGCRHAGVGAVRDKPRITRIGLKEG